MSLKKNHIKHLLFSFMWLAIAACGIVLLVAAMRTKDQSRCRGIEIEISGVSNNFFIDKADVRQVLTDYCGGKLEGVPIRQFDLAAIENRLKKNVWIKNAELFFDGNDFLRVSIDEREPAARIFSVSGESFYIDSSRHILPLSDKFSARLPVFTGFRSSPGLLSKADSALLLQVKDISKALQADSFLMAMIDQVDITPQRNFEMIPKIGNQVILFGNADRIDEKCRKLKIFYKEVIAKAGWNKYSQVNLQFKNQVVAKLRDAADKSSDSLRALQMMQTIAERAEQLASDSMQYLHQNAERQEADSSIIEKSLQRDEDEAESETRETIAPSPVKANTPPAIAPKPVVTKPVVKIAPKPAPKPMTKPEKKPGAKPAAKPPVQKPKAVMGENN